jgi:hypothetical protein
MHADGKVCEKIAGNKHGTSHAHASSSMRHSWNERPSFLHMCSLHARTLTSLSHTPVRSIAALWQLKVHTHPRISWLHQATPVTYLV